MATTVLRLSSGASTCVHTTRMRPRLAIWHGVASWPAACARACCGTARCGAWPAVGCLGAAHGSKGEAEGPQRERPTTKMSRRPYVGVRGARRVAGRVLARVLGAALTSPSSYSIPRTGFQNSVTPKITN
jgi:hypothetical protein